MKSSAKTPKAYVDPVTARWFKQEYRYTARKGMRSRRIDSAEEKRPREPTILPERASWGPAFAPLLIWRSRPYRIGGNGSY